VGLAPWFIDEPGRQLTIGTQRIAAFVRTSFSRPVFPS
jgi:hypothetical protein